MSVWPILAYRDAPAAIACLVEAFGFEEAAADGLFARATAAGAEVVHGLVDQDYGSREFAVRDPEGNQWSFGTYRGAAQ